MASSISELERYQPSPEKQKLTKDSSREHDQASEAEAALNAREKAAHGLQDKTKHSLDSVLNLTKDEAVLKEAADIASDVDRTSRDMHEAYAALREEVDESWHKWEREKHDQSKVSAKTDRTERQETKKFKRSKKTEEIASDVTTADFDKKFQAKFERDWNNEVASAEASEKQAKVEKEWFEKKEKKVIPVDKEVSQSIKKTEAMKKYFLTELRADKLDKDTINVAGSLFTDLPSGVATAETIAGTMNILAARGVDQNKLDLVLDFIIENFPAMAPNKEMLHQSEEKIGDEGLEEEWDNAVRTRHKPEKDAKRNWQKNFDDLEKKFMAAGSKEGGRIAVARAIIASGKSREEVMAAAKEFKPKFIDTYLPEKWDFDRAKVEIPKEKPTTILGVIKRSWKTMFS